MDEIRQQPAAPQGGHGETPSSPLSGQGGTPPPNIPAEPNPQPGPAQPNPQPEKQEEVFRQQPKPFHPEQKRVYLERAEVRTMNKDVARIREEEAKKEQQRVAELKALKEKEEKVAIEKIRSASAQIQRKEDTPEEKNRKAIQSSILPPSEERRLRSLPPPPSPRKKIAIRLFVVAFFAFIALNVLFLASWFLFFRDQTTSLRFPQIPLISSFFSKEEPYLPSPPQPGGETPQTPSQPSSDTLLNILASGRESLLEFTDARDLSTLLVQYLQREQEPAFTELRFREMEESDTLANGSAFFELFGVELPESIAPHLAGDTFFFSYSYERGNRFGIIAELSDPAEAREAFLQWEPQMEETLVPVLPFWGARGVAYTTAFRARVHAGTELRYQTFSLQDYGIVHAFQGDYVIFASSFEATIAAIEALQDASLNTLQSKFFGDAGKGDVLYPPPELSFEQALGQVFMLGFEDTTLTPELQDLIQRLRPGGVLLLSKNIESAGQLRQLTHDLQRVALESSSLPLFIAVDQEGGSVSRIEFSREKTPQSVIQNAEQAYRVGRLRAEELKGFGVNLNLSPVLDSALPGDFLFSRTFQASGLQAGKLAKALLQGQKEQGILSTVKHFPGYGNISFNPEQRLAVAETFPDISSFIFTLPAQPEFLLLSNVIYPDLDPDYPFTFSPKGISLVRSDLNFQGIILSDDLSQPSLSNAYAFEDIITLPLAAGVNMIMFSQQPYAQKAHLALAELAQQNSLLQENIEKSAARILSLKKEFFFGLKPAAPADHLSQK